MKRALKYFMENKSYDYKSSDYDDYKTYLKYSTNGTTLLFTDRDSIARIKKKYTRIWLFFFEILYLPQYIQYIKKY